MAEPVRATIFANHQAFRITEPGKTLSRARADRSNGLIDPQPGGVAVVFTGVHTGEVGVTVDVRDQAPAVDITDWDDVIEVSFHAPEGQARVASVGAETETEHLLPVITPTGPGDYRIRVHVRGRDSDIAVDGDEGYFDEDDDDDYDGALDEEEPTEEYLITVWPAPPAPPTVYMQTDARGAELRNRQPNP